MGEAKFTKGEWVSHDKRPYCNGFSIFAGSQYVAFVGDSDNVTECKANANLITAAPEMYKEIERDIDWLEMMKAKFVLGSYEYRSICLRIESKQKLLAKARGEHNG